jgi:hypothetical protein
MHKLRPIVFGTGLVAMDVILHEEDGHSQARLAAGGTCGNVLAILAYLGWESHTIARLGFDPASRRVSDLLTKAGVSMDFAALEPVCETPIIFQINSVDAAGVPSHRFTSRCPGCGGWLPNYRPVTVRAATAVALAAGLLAEAGSAPALFFFDRVSPAALMLANDFAQLGALVVFEPAGFADHEQFLAALRVAHVVKYANDRMRKFRDVLERARAGGGNWILEIETSGKKGLRYRAPGCGLAGWRCLPAVGSPRHKDAAGAGDWCTAVLLNAIGRDGVAGVRKLELAELERALVISQAYASLSCGFVGARGMMECQTPADTASAAERLLEGKGSLGDPTARDGETVQVASRHHVTARYPFCVACT